LPSEKQSNVEPSPLALKWRTQLPLILLALLIAFHCGANLWWLSQDHHTIRTDEEGHMHWARKYYTALFLGDDQSVLERLVATTKIEPGHPAHPPLVHVAGALMVRAFGYSTLVLSATNTLCFALLLLGCFLIVRRFLDPWPALYAVFVVSFTPLIFTASRYFMTDYLSLMLTVWSVYALLRSNYFRETEWVFLFALLNGLGILSRTVTFLYYLAPCGIVLLLGLVSVLPFGGRRFDSAGFKRFVFNCLLTGVVSVGVFAPWYYAHLDRFYTYWAHEHVPGSGGPVAIKSAEVKKNMPKKAPPVSSVDGTTAKQTPASATSAASPKKVTPRPIAAQPSFLGKVMKKILRPSVSWKRYPVHTINNATFLPLFVMGVLGIPIVLFSRRFRSLEAVLLVAWLLGSYFLMTTVLKYGTPRYTLQALPALAILGAITAMSPPSPKYRQLLGGGLAFVLLMGYGNLSFISYGPVGTIGIPVAGGAKVKKMLGADEFYILKDELTIGFSYSGLGAPTQTNYKDELFTGMLERENEAEHLVKGDYANYLRLNVRGMEFDEKHYWPAPNPFLRKDLPPGQIPRRKFRSIGLASTPERLMSKLPNADYIVYAVDGADPEVERQWQSYFENRRFKVIKTFQEDAYGRVPERRFGVMSRRSAKKVIKVGKLADVSRLNLYELYALKISSDYAKMNEKARNYIQSRFKALVSIGSKPLVLNDSLSFMTAEVAHIENEWYELRLIFEVKKSIEKEWRMYCHGLVEDKYKEQLPKRCRAQGYVDWNFNPDPPTTSWPADDYIIVSHRINAQKFPYWIKVGFNVGDEYFGSSVQLGWVDFGALPE